VFLRELLQNSRDALIARAGGGELSPAWAVHIRPATTERPFTIVDDGIGLAADEVEDLLATVGRSSKRDVLDMPNSDFLGQFGIGLLSCLMVADAIELVSRKEGRLAVHWRGQADGTFTVTELTKEQSDAVDIGTRVSLEPSPDHADMLGFEGITALVRRYAEYLPIPVLVETPAGGAEQLTRPAPFLANLVTDRATVLDFGESMIGHAPLDAIEIDIPGTATTGIAYVLAHPASGRERAGARVYLGRMLVATDEPQLMPGWAFFVRAVVSSDGLTPTASREALVRDDALTLTREGIAQAVRGWISGLAERNRALLRTFLATHDLAIRAACVEDDELFRMVGPLLTFETAAGTHTLEEIALTGGAIEYANSLDEFRMLTGLGATSRLVNASFVYHEELLLKAHMLFGDITVTEADVMGRVRELAEPAAEDLARTKALAARATAALANVDVEAVIKILPSAGLMSLYVADAEVLTRVDMQRASEIARGPWAAALRTAAERVDEVRSRRGPVATRAQICLNWGNPLVQRLAELRDESVLQRTVRVLYVQALLAGRRPLTERDRALMSESLDDLVTLSVGIEE